MARAINFYEVKDILMISNTNIRMRSARMEEAEQLPGKETFLGIVNCINSIAAKYKEDLQDNVIIRVSCNNVVCSCFYKHDIFEIIAFYDFDNEKPSNISFESKKGVINGRLKSIKMTDGVNEEYSKIKRFYYSNIHPEGAFEYV